MNDTSSQTGSANIGGADLIGPPSNVTPPSSGFGRAAYGGDFEIQGSEKGAKEQVAKLTARLNASRVSDAEVKALYEERQELVAKQLGGIIANRELARLDYVRWSLDRIEDGKHGAALDELESQIVQFEKVASQLRHLNEDLTSAATPNRRR